MNQTTVAGLLSIWHHAGELVRLLAPGVKEGPGDEAPGKLVVHSLRALMALYRLYGL